MKNCWYISIILLLLLGATCKKNVNTHSVINKKIFFIDYCAIVDSLKFLPEFDYNLVKDKTKILVHPLTSMIDTATINNYKRQGYRVVLMQPQPNLREQDSARYSTGYMYLAEKIMIKRIADSINRKTGIKPSTETVWYIYTEKLKKRKCQ